MSKYSDNMPPDLLGAVEWMIGSVKKDTTLIDFGCSTGYFGRYLKDTKNCKVYGVEINEDDIKQAKKVLDGVYSFDLDGSWPTKIYERQYDYLFFGDVLEHLKDPETVLMKSKKLLKNGGKIFVSVPNIAHLSIRLELLTGNFQYESMGILDNTHLKYFTLMSFKEMSQRAGYTIEKIDYTTSDYPKEVSEQLLKKSGLLPTSKFWKISKSVEARAFQYKFILKPRSEHKGSGAIAIEPIVKPEQYRDDFINDLKNQIIAVDNHNKEQAKIIEYYKERADTLEKEKNSVVNHSILKKIRHYRNK